MALHLITSYCNPEIPGRAWKRKDWTSTRTWLQRIVTEAEGEETFYSELAKARLARVEY